VVVKTFGQIAVARLYRPAYGASFANFSAVLMLAFWLVGCSDTTAPPASQIGRPNVVLISLDTTRRDHLSCYGYPRPTTPEIDTVAAESLLFTNSWANSNWTLPTHASLLTGLYPDTHGARFLSPDEVGDHALTQYEGKLLPSCPTAAELLGQSGYRTGAVLANYGYLSRRFKLDRGFEHYDARRGRAPCWYRSGSEITDEALRWLKNADDRPFFLFVNYMDAHLPYNPPPEYVKRFATHYTDADLMPLPEAYFRELFLEENVRRSPLDESRRTWLADRYDGGLAYMDAQVGRLIAGLRALGAYDNTLIVITSDHGESLGEHATWGHCMRLFEPELTVPLIVKSPGDGARGVRSDPAQSVDVLPTILATLSLPKPPEVAGRSLLEVAECDIFAKKHLDLRMQSFPSPVNQHQWAMYRGPLKYLEFSAGPPELYDLSTDPGELNNLASSRQSDVETLAEALESWRDRTCAHDPYEPAYANASQEDAEALRELGYAQ